MVCTSEYCLHCVWVLFTVCVWERAVLTVPVAACTGGNVPSTTSSVCLSVCLTGYYSHSSTTLCQFHTRTLYLNETFDMICTFSLYVVKYHAMPYYCFISSHPLHLVFIRFKVFVLSVWGSHGLFRSEEVIEIHQGCRWSWVPLNVQTRENLVNNTLFCLHGTVCVYERALILENVLSSCIVRCIFMSWIDAVNRAWCIQRVCVRIDHDIIVWAAALVYVIHLSQKVAFAFYDIFVMLYYCEWK